MATKKRPYDRGKTRAGKKYYHVELTEFSGYYTRTVPKIGVTRYAYHFERTWVRVWAGFVGPGHHTDLHSMSFNFTSQAKEVALSRCVRGFRADVKGAKIAKVLEKITSGPAPKGWRVAG